jgi:hypothetical protein
MKPRRAPTEPVPWRNAEDAAAYVGLGIDTFRAAVKAGEVAVIEGRGQQRFLLVDLDAYLMHQRTPAAWERVASARTGKVVSLPTTGTNVLTGQPREQAR